MGRIGLAAAALALVAGFFFLVNVADTADPGQTEVRIAVPDLLKAP